VITENASRSFWCRSKWIEEELRRRTILGEGLEQIPSGNMRVWMMRIFFPGSFPEGKYLNIRFAGIVEM